VSHRKPVVVLAVLAGLLAGAPVAAAATAADAPTHTAQIGKQKIGYRSIGTGPPIVFIQGLSGSMDGWDPTFLDSLAASGHRVVVFDNEGIGRSTALPGRLTIRRMGANTARLIKALHLKRPDVAGWSMGGMIAQSFAVRHPRSLRRLALLATAPGDGKAVAPLPDALALLKGDGTDVTGLLNQLFPPDQTAARDTYVTHLLTRKNFVPLIPAKVVKRQISASITWLTGGDKDGARVKALHLPVLVGGGELDHLLPVGNQRHIAKIIKGAKLVTYPDAAHGFFFQHAEDFLPRLVKFFGR
jgi:pimeloyl-ACP methyl ester carboxylesterase